MKIIIIFNKDVIKDCNVQILVRVDLESQNLAVKEEERLFLSCKS
jgi:hypothetical protein